jgi:hypothetical protein
MLHQAAMLIIFFIAAVPKDSQRFPKLPCKHESILLSHYVRSIASPAAAWQLRYSFIFLWLMNVEQTL